MITLNTYNCYPIWEDIYISTEGTALAALDSATVEVFKGEDLQLFSGLVKKRPGENALRVCVNDIIAPYIRPQLAYDEITAQDSGVLLDAAGAEPGVMPLFKVSWNDGALVTRFYAFGDWSWDRSRKYEIDESSLFHICPAVVLTSPVDGKIVPGQFIFLSSILAETAHLSKYVDTGSGIGFADFAISQRIEGGVLLPGPSTFYFRVENFPESVDDKYLVMLYRKPTSPSGVAFDVYGVVGMKLIPACHRYVLYYVNAFGGWDWFVIQGRVVESDNVSRSEYTKRAETSNPASRGREVLQVEIEKHLEMHTHWLNDDESSRMHHLTESPSVYVHDLITDTISPALITGTTHEYKTYKNQGGRLVSYQLDVVIAVNQERR